MGLPQKKQEYFTYADYINLDENERWEIIEGEPYCMSPAPLRVHQEILGELFGEIRNYLKDKDCKVYAAPFDVRLPYSEEYDDEKIDTVVQPDISVICDEKKLDEKGCCGAPDFIIEVISPSNASHDYIKKLALYENRKVKEYWIVDPTNAIIVVYLLENDKYGKPKYYSKKDVIEVQTLSDLKISLNTIFAE